jgi:transcriptional regulator with AAA-type ATPase domain/NAD-dependent dihydropyrimidine dehydrogenase PreA subunit
MTLSNHVIWLQERTPLSLLHRDSVLAIARGIEQRQLPAHHALVTAGEDPEGLFILRRGKLETPNAQIGDVSFLPGAVINLESLLLDQTTEKTVVTLTEATMWFVRADYMRQLLLDYPDILRTFSRRLVEEVKRLSFQFSFEQERQAMLRPYLVTKARRGVIGRSRYARRLRQQVRDASQDRDPVLLFGEPGLEKDNLAALIHYGSEVRRDPIIQIDCSKVQASGADLFGRAGGKPGLVEALGRGTLVFNNIQELPRELLPDIVRLVKTHTYLPVSRDGDPMTDIPKASQARLIFITEQAIPDLNAAIPTRIKVPPLRVRKADISDQVDYYLSLICRRRGINRVRITPEAIRRLQAYDFPNNLRELENLVERAVTQMTPGGLITEEILWPSQSKKSQFRLNLLNTYPRLRQFLRSPWWPDRLNYGLVMGGFAVVVVLLFAGPQTRDRNVALHLFWAWWWPLVLIGFPFVGRLWCSICPFMIYGEVTQKLSLWLLPRALKRWPRQEAERWGGWFLFGLFALILIWEEVWNLENTAYLSSCLLLLITAGAVIFSAIFERRFWCRYLCPIGGMNGLFAKLSMTELRAQQGTCSAECTTYQCYKGGPQKGEGQETGGCPLYSHPAQLEDNRDCVLCMTCLKACPHRSVELNLRPPAIELWTTHLPRSYEVALLFLLLGAVFLHRLPELQQWLGVSLDLSSQWIHAGVSGVVLAGPAIAVFLAHGLLHLSYRLVPILRPRPLIKLAYGYLPLVWAASLAHYLRLGLLEAGKVLPTTLATFQLTTLELPYWIAHPAVLAFLQATLLVLGTLTSFWCLLKIARQPLQQLWPHGLCILLTVASLWQITVGV